MSAASEPYSIHGEVPWANRLAAAAIFILQHKFRESAFLERARKANVRSIRRKLSRRLERLGRSKGRVIEIERRRDLGDREFVSRYLNKGLPVVFEGAAADWPCTRKWNADHLRDRLGETKLAFHESAGLMEPEYDITRGTDQAIVAEELSANDFVAGLKRGERKYLRFSTLMESDRSFVDDLDATWLRRMRRCFFGSGYHAFIGPAGRYTPAHQDTTAVFYIMADGEKRWTLFSAASSALIQAAPTGRVYNFADVDPNDPDLGKYPGFDLLSRYVCTLRKGDVLFLPTWTWHHVENLTESWGVSYRFPCIRDFIRYPAFVFVRSFLMKPSFFSVCFGRQTTLLTPRIFGD